jgi:hypothetical protein
MDGRRWRYADYRSHRMADGCCADGTARTMGVRRWAPRGDQCLADCSTTFGTRWGGSGSLISWQAAGAAGWGSGSAAKLAHTRCPVRRVRAARLPAHTHGMPAPAAAAATAAAPAPPGWRTGGPREPGACHPSPGHAHGTPALTAVAAPAPPPWLRPTSAVALPSRSRTLTCPGERRPCAQPFCGVGSVSRAFTHWTHPSARWRSHLRPFAAAASTAGRSAGPRSGCLPLQTPTSSESPAPLLQQQ